MKAKLALTAFVAAALALLLSAPGQAQTTCLDSATSVETADESRTDYDFDGAGKAVDARGVRWSGVPDHAIQPDGSRTGCWIGGDVAGPYPEDSVYECAPEHCPDGGCPEPCWAYHTTAGMRVDTAAPMTVEDVRISDYGDGIERSVSANRQPLVVKRAYLHDIHDDAIENDWGADITVVDSLLERVNTAFASRFRSGEDIDARDRIFEVRDSLILAHRFTHSYKNKPGHGSFWKWPKDGKGPNFVVTGNTFVVTDPGGGLLLPLANQLLECADNTVLWAASRASFDDWLGDDERGSDGLDNAGRVEALSGCFSFVLKPDGQGQPEFLAEHFHPLVAAWKQSHPAAGVDPGGWNPPPGEPPQWACSDGTDNDFDGNIDFPDDPGCSDFTDDSEDSEGMPPDPSVEPEPTDPSVDADADGFPLAADCDDLEPSVNPDAREICDDAVDNDCDRRVDCADRKDCRRDLVCTYGGGGKADSEPDKDGDGLVDPQDNCLETPNADQTDSDLDGFGNACDADYDGDGTVHAADFIVFGAAYGALASDDRYDPSVDLNADDVIDTLDFIVLSRQWGGPPGPSGLACAGTVPCP
jgi:hypothetical protein